MKKSKKFKALKKQFIYESSQNPESILTTPKVHNEIPKVQVKPVLINPSSDYKVIKNPFILNDLKKVLISTSIVILLLVLIYIFRNNFWIQKFEDWLYISLHLG